LLLHSSRSTTGLLEVYRASAAWTGIEDDAIWEALQARARAWAVRMALALLLVYPEGHSLGRIGRRLLAS
ncbi:aminoglycoside phosphotransferase, partial [Microbacterium oxydans]